MGFFIINKDTLRTIVPSSWYEENMEYLLPIFADNFSNLLNKCGGKTLDQIKDSCGSLKEEYAFRETYKSQVPPGHLDGVIR